MNSAARKYVYRTDPEPDRNLCCCNGSFDAACSGSWKLQSGNAQYFLLVKSDSRVIHFLQNPSPACLKAYLGWLFPEAEAMALGAASASGIGTLDSRARSIA